MLEYLKQPEIAFLLFASILSILLTIKSKKVLSIIITTIIILLPLSLIILKLANVSIPAVGSFSIELIAAIISAISLLANNVISLCQKASDNLFNEALSSLDNKAIALLDKKGNLIKFMQNFYDELNLNYNDNVEESVSEIYLFNQRIDYKTFLNELKENEGKDFKVTFIFSNAINNEEISLNLIKEPVELDGVICGYIITLIDKPFDDDSVDGFSLVIDDLDVPYAYYNDNSRNIVYLINKRFKELLGIKGRTVTHTELRHLVFSEDLEVFDAASNEMALDDTYNYRIKTTNGYKMFSQVKLTKLNNIISIISLIEEKENNIISKSEALEIIDKKIKDSENFAAVIVSINGYIKAFNGYGAVVARELRDKYLEFIQKEVLKENDLICKVSDSEYILLFNNCLDVDQIVRDIMNNTSVLSNYEFNYNDITINTNNTFGISYFDKQFASAKEFMLSLDSALAYANNEGYDKVYSIYNKSSKLDTNKLTKDILVKDYSFDKIKIDLDNSFLDDENDL